MTTIKNAFEVDPSNIRREQKEGNAAEHCPLQNEIPC